jgi:sulfate adenylyltransferase subunit 2
MSSTEDLNAHRRRAVELRLSGATWSDISRQTGLSVTTLISAFKSFKSGGWTAVAVGRRGRQAGQGRRLPHEAESELHAVVTRDDPRTHDLEGDLWSSDQVAALLRKRWGLALAPRTLARFLERLGLSVRTLAEGAAHVAEAQRWLNHEWPVVQREVRRNKAALYWCGARNVDTADGPHVILVAATLRGRVLWRSVPNATTADVWLELFDSLSRLGGSGVGVLLHRLDLPHAPALRQGIADRADRLTVWPCPVDLWARATPAPRGAGARAAPAAQPAAGSTSPRIAPVAATHSEDPMANLTHLQRLEAESIHIIREVVAECDNPVMLYSIGKDSAVMLHLARKAFFPAVPPFPLMHVDTTWKFRDMYALRERMVRESGMKLIVHVNQQGLEMGVNPFTHGSQIHTDVMKTQALKQALDLHGFDAAFGGARRDEEKSRAKERIFSFRTAQHRWDPKNQRPELWHLYNARKHKGESIRAFPLSNWTELDVWQYIWLNDIPIVPLYFARPRPVVERDGMLIMVDDERMPLKPGEVPAMRKVRFRTLGCYPLSGAVESDAETLTEVIQEMLLTRTSERQGRMIDHDAAASMEKKKQEGYF